MVCFYIVRSVTRSASCGTSYKEGESLVGGFGFDTWKAAQSFADKFNNHCNVPGVDYRVIESDESIDLTATYPIC